MLKQFLAVLVGFWNPHSLRGFSFSSPPAYPLIVYSDPKLVFHPFPFPWFVQLNWVRWCITPTNHFGVLHSLNSINHNLWVENPTIGNSSVHKGYSPPEMYSNMCPKKGPFQKEWDLLPVPSFFRGKLFVGVAYLPGSTWTWGSLNSCVSFSVFLGVNFSPPTKKIFLCKNQVLSCHSYILIRKKQIIEGDSGVKMPRLPPTKTPCFVSYPFLESIVNNPRVRTRTFHPCAVVKCSPRPYAWMRSTWTRWPKPQKEGIPPQIPKDPITFLLVTCGCPTIKKKGVTCGWKRYP